MQFLSSTSEEEEEQDKKRIKKEEHFGHLATFYFGTFAMLFHANVVLLVTKALEDEWHVVIKACKFTIFVRLFCIVIFVCPRYPYIYSLLTRQCMCGLQL